MVLFQQFMVDTGFIIIAIHPACGNQFAQIVITRFIFRQENQVVTITILLAGAYQATTFRVSFGLFGHIHLTTEDGFENVLFGNFYFGTALLYFLHRFLRRSMFCLYTRFRIILLLQSFQFLLQVLDFPFHRLVMFINEVEKLFNAEHIAMVGDSHRIHACFEASFHQSGDG